MPRTFVLLLSIAAAGCGVPKDFVKTETHNAFNNASSVAAHVKLKCGEAADANCTQVTDKLGQLCHALDELAKQAGSAGFDCASWKEKP